MIIKFKKPVRFYDVQTGLSDVEFYSLKRIAGFPYFPIVLSIEGMLNRSVKRMINKSFYWPDSWQFHIDSITSRNIR